MVLIFSSNDDGSTHEVIEWLDSFEVDWFRINETDQVNLKNLEFKNNQVERLVLKINDAEIDITKCNSYWYRRGFLNWAQRGYKSKNIVEYRILEHLDLELENIDYFVHKYLEDTKIGINSFLNSPNNKTYYQFVAANVGLNVPNSLITTQKSDFENFYANSSRVITKSVNEGLIFFHGGLNLYSTTAEIQEDVSNSLDDSFFPSYCKATLKNLPN